MQSVQESIPQFLLKIFLTSFIYLKLSIFQRHHAQHRVFPEIATAGDQVTRTNSKEVEERVVYA